MIYRICKRILYVLLVLNYCHIPAFAIETRFSGTLETYGAVYTQHKSGSEDLSGEFHLKPLLTLIPNDQLLAVVNLDLRQDTAGYTQGFVNSLPDRESRRATVAAREAYVEYTPLWLRLRSGILLFDWAVTDTMSVADNLNPRDWHDLIRWERVGVPALDVRVGGDSFIQAVYVPWFTPSRVPPDNGRWSPPAQSGVTAAEQDLPAPGNGQWGMRVGTVWNGFDLGSNAYAGYNFSPAGRLTPTSATSALLTPYYRRMEVYGVSAAKEVFGYNLRMESGYFRQHGGDRFIQYIGGIDREWGSVFRQTDSLYLLIQYADETILSRGANPLLFDFRRVFVKNVLGKLKYNVDDTREWSFKLEGSYNLRDRDSYIEPSIAWSRFAITIEAGVDIMDGRADTFWGTYRNNSRIFVKGAYQF